jgi:hypothetical protein
MAKQKACTAKQTKVMCWSLNENEEEDGSRYAADAFEEARQVGARHQLPAPGPSPKAKHDANCANPRNAQKPPCCFTKSEHCADVMDQVKFSLVAKCHHWTMKNLETGMAKGCISQCSNRVVEGFQGVLKKCARLTKPLSFAKAGTGCSADALEKCRPFLLGGTDCEACMAKQKACTAKQTKIMCWSMDENEAEDGSRESVDAFEEARRAGQHRRLSQQTSLFADNVVTPRELDWVL